MGRARGRVGKERDLKIPPSPQQTPVYAPEIERYGREKEGRMGR